MNVNEIIINPENAPKGTVVVKDGVAYVKNTVASQYEDGTYRDSRNYPWVSTNSKSPQLRACGWTSDHVRGATIVYLPKTVLKKGDVLTAVEIRALTNVESYTVIVRADYKGVAFQYYDSEGWLSTDDHCEFRLVDNAVKFEVISVPS